MQSDLIELLKVKKFSLKAEKVDFTDVEFMSATEKTKVYKKWVSFLNNHFSEKQFSKQLYQHLHAHCGYIAHYNRYGFYGEYFGKGAILNKLAFGVEHTPNENSGIWTGSIKFFGKDSLEAKEAFYTVYHDLLNGEQHEGLRGFKRNWNGAGYMGASFDGDYGDLNIAMRKSLQEYVSVFENMISEAQVKLQQKRMKATVITAKEQLDLIESDIVEDDGKPLPVNNNPLSLFDIVVAA